MAKKTSSPAVGQGSAGAKREKKIPIENLRRSCVKLFGVSPSTFDGATHGLPAGSKYTVEEMKATIDKWLEKEVK